LLLHSRTSTQESVQNNETNYACRTEEEIEKEAVRQEAEEEEEEAEDDEEGEEDEARFVMLSLMLQICSPVVLELSGGFWAAESILLRFLLADSLLDLVDVYSLQKQLHQQQQHLHMNSQEGKRSSIISLNDTMIDETMLTFKHCIIHDAPSTIGARGLFLLAYQVN
jgi:hypothetical protein